MTADAPQPVQMIARGRIITMDPTRRIIEDGAIAIDKGLIVAVGAHADIAGRYRAADMLGGPDALLTPGFIDAHTHCTQCFVRGLTSGELPMIPRIYNPAQRVLTADEAASTVRLLSAQMLRAGVTTLCEGTLNPDHETAILETLEEVGIRSILARGRADQDFHHASLYSQINDRSWVKARDGEAESDLLRTEDLLQRFPSRGDGLIHAAVNASALLGFSPRYFTEGAALARRFDSTLQVHIGRDREEVEFCLDVWKRRPVERLFDLGVVDEHLVAVHAVLASEREIEILAKGKAALAHSPTECVANMNAIPNLPRFRAAGIRVALGCDNQANDMFATMRAAWLIHGARWGVERFDPEFLPAGELLEMSTIESASSLRIDHITGSLEPGKAADFLVMDGTAPHFMASQDVTSELVRYGSRAEILQTVVAGRVLYDRGNFATIDMQGLRDEATAGAAKVRQEVVDRRYRPLPAF
ncbi:amidohydrolase family protein [Nitratireductor sp. CAU 1489]|uniref:Amidohydrolase family protein n=1 Tax=Nitratireductor arenosus TaxID=2682096 RepID=A0A844QAX2_9HYPH|nr:amidohydrolase family protein [Nitratireductor arenosus]MVA95794.1 amidohydrolase family protein [Nitratireductor arenosus]